MTRRPGEGTLRRAVAATLRLPMAPQPTVCRPRATHAKEDRP